MAPLTLVGKNLGERHRHLNAAVNEASSSQRDFENFEGAPEQSPIDRIFKINLASKVRNVDYILKNVKDDDMLYVSKALKCKWLLGPGYEHIVNPQYLEDCLYPSMVTTAVTRMKHWLFVNIKDPIRCQKFFLYYCETNLKLAVKFLRNCDSDFIEEQFPKYMNTFTPHDFKMLCQRSPLVVKMFFDAIVTDEHIKHMYLCKEKQYFATLKSLLKSNGAVVLDVTEKYFNKQKIKPFNSKATKFIMKHYRARFLQKPQLYTAWLLDMKTLASRLSADDAIDLTITLARDNYLVSENWFSYKKVEPLIRRIKPEDRGAIKKKVFVDKDVGIIVEKWPFEMPSVPVCTPIMLPIFKDDEQDPCEYDGQDFRKMLKKRKYAKWGNYKAPKTMLDKLFDEYRVASYDKTLFELRKKLRSESSAQHRQYMMLVLVSKSGGHEDNVAALMELLGDYKNEASQIRAAVVRSLVKRARVWRAPAHTWNQLLEFSHGLGLDGKSPETDCIEGIHAVVIRQILDEKTCNREIFSIYLNNFSTFKEYSLSIEEKHVISDILPKLLFAKVCDGTNCEAATTLEKLLDTLTAFRLSIAEYPGLVPKIESLARDDMQHVVTVLVRLFRSRIARRELFAFNFEILRTEDSYLNALRHDVGVISIDKLLERIIKSNDAFKYVIFFRKVSIYFVEEGGLAKQFLDGFKNHGHQKVLAKLLVLLLRDELKSYVKNDDSSIVGMNHKPFAAAIRANLHLSRPAFDIDSFGWSAVGTKAVANKVLVCRATEVDNNVQKLLQNKRTVRLAYALAKKNGRSDYLNCFTVLSNFKPTAALKLGLKVLVDDRISACQSSFWNVIKSLLENFGTDTDSKKYVKLPDVSSVCVQVRPEYSVILYNMYKKESFYKSIPLLCHIDNLLSRVPQDTIDNLLVEYLNDGLPDIPEKYLDILDIIDCDCLYIRIAIRYLLLCKTEESQKERYERIGVRLFNKMTIWLQSDKDKKRCRKYLEELLTSFRYYAVFLNDDYVSCMPVMTEALAWMREHLPMETLFKYFVHMHLNMLYYTAIKKSIGALPERRIHDGNQTEARKTVGNIFGKYIASEIDNLKNTYFSSVQYMYKDIMLSLQYHFLHSCDIYMEALIDGLLARSAETDASAGAGAVLAVFLSRQKSRPSLERVSLRLTKCQNIETQMIFFAESFLHT